MFEKMVAEYRRSMVPEHSRRQFIEPVVDTVPRDLEVIRDLGLTPSYTLETHVHADHISAGVKMRAIANTQIVVPKIENLPCADIDVEEDTVFAVVVSKFIRYLRLGILDRTMLI